MRVYLGEVFIPCLPLDCFFSCRGQVTPRRTFGLRGSPGLPVVFVGPSRWGQACQQESSPSRPRGRQGPSRTPGQPNYRSLLQLHARVIPTDRRGGRVIAPKRSRPNPITGSMAGSLPRYRSHLDEVINREIVESRQRRSKSKSL